MALVKYGAGVTQISGSIGGDVHARNRFGNWIRPRTKPVNPHSERQEHARAVASYLAEYWHSPAMAEKRGAWNNYAAAVAMKNRLGETIHLTGFNHFIRSGAASVGPGYNHIDVAPTIMSLPEKDYMLKPTEASVLSQEITFYCDKEGWAGDGDPKVIILVYMGRPQLASRNFFDGPWRYMGGIDAGSGVMNEWVHKGSYDFTLGQKIWFQARVLTVQYRLSERWTLAPIEAVAGE